MSWLGSSHISVFPGAVLAEASALARFSLVELVKLESLDKVLPLALWEGVWTKGQSTPTPHKNWS